MKQAKIETPWGVSQSVDPIAPGIDRVSTASHGGFRLSQERLDAMPATLRTFGPWAGAGWYEEDCDWAVVALAFPGAFTPADVRAAVRTVRCEGLEINRLAAWLDTPEAARVVAIAEDYERTMGAARMYQPGSAGTSGRGWDVYWQPIGHDGPRLRCRHADYPAEPMPAEALEALGAVAV